MHMMYISPQKTVQEDIRMKKEKVILAYSGGPGYNGYYPMVKREFQLRRHLLLRGLRPGKRAGRS
jgi:hypothetical protein